MTCGATDCPCMAAEALVLQAELAVVDAQLVSDNDEKSEIEMEIAINLMNQMEGGCTPPMGRQRKPKLVRMQKALRDLRKRSSASKRTLKRLKSKAERLRKQYTLKHGKRAS